MRKAFAVLVALVLCQAALLGKPNRLIAQSYPACIDLNGTSCSGSCGPCVIDYGDVMDCTCFHGTCSCPY